MRSENLPPSAMTVTYQPLLAREMEMELRSRLHFDSLMMASQFVPGVMTTNSCMPYLQTHTGSQQTFIHISTYYTGRNICFILYAVRSLGNNL